MVRVSTNTDHRWWWWERRRAGRAGEWERSVRYRIESETRDSVVELPVRHEIAVKLTI